MSSEYFFSAFEIWPAFFECDVPFLGIKCNAHLCFFYPDFAKQPAQLCGRGRCRGDTHHIVRQARMHLDECALNRRLSNPAAQTKQMAAIRAAPLWPRASLAAMARGEPAGR